MASRHLVFGIWLASAVSSVTAGCVGTPTDPSIMGIREAEIPPAVLSRSWLSQTADAAIQIGSSPAQLETIAASRGALALDVTVLGSTHTSPDVVTTMRVSLVELVEQLGDGAEQSWQFEQAPGQNGDLTIAVGVTGLDYVSTTAGGLHLRHHGEFEVGYSHGVWVDADGHRTAVPARYQDGRILLTVPALVITRSVFPAVLDPKIIVTPIPG